MILWSGGCVLGVVLSSGKVTVPKVSAVMKLMVSWGVHTSDRAKSAQCYKREGLCVFFGHTRKGSLPELRAP